MGVSNQKQLIPRVNIFHYLWVSTRQESNISVDINVLLYFFKYYNIFKIKNK